MPETEPCQQIDGSKLTPEAEEHAFQANCVLADALVTALVTRQPVKVEWTFDFRDMGLPDNIYVEEEK